MPFVWRRRGKEERVSTKLRHVLLVDEDIFNIISMKWNTNIISANQTGYDVIKLVSGPGDVTSGSTDKMSLKLDLERLNSLENDSSNIVFNWNEVLKRNWEFPVKGTRSRFPPRCHGYQHCKQLLQRFLVALRLISSRGSGSGSDPVPPKQRLTRRFLSVRISSLADICGCGVFRWQ